MRAAPLLLLWLLAAPEAPAPADPVAALPAALRPGAAATFAQEARGERLAGTTVFRALAGEAAGEVLLVREYATADLGPLTWRDRLTIRLDAASRLVRGFDYEAGGAGDAPLRRLSRLSPHPERAGEFVFERFRYPEKGEPQVSRLRVKPAGPFAPDVAEPFLAALLPPEGGSIAVLETVTGRLSTVPAVYTPLGEGTMTVGTAKVPCRIALRKRGAEEETVYFRTADGMPLRHAAAGLSPAPPAPAKEDGR